MIPQEPVFDVMRRTMVNLKYIEDGKTEDGPYEVTQLVNSFLGALAHPWEKFRQNLKLLSIAEAEDEGWPHIVKGSPNDQDPENLGELIRLIRNGLAHGNIEFLPDENNEIRAVRIWNLRNGQRTWCTELTVANMRTFLKCFVKQAEKLHETGALRQNHDLRHQ